MALVRNLTPDLAPDLTPGLLLQGTDRLLCVATTLGYLAVCQAVLTKFPTSIKDEDGVTGMRALGVAAQLNQLDILQLLLEYRPVVNAPDFAGRSALSYAVMQLLVEHRAHLDATDDEGHTAMHLAAREGQAASLDLLGCCHAKANVKDKTGATALMYAAGCGSLECVRVLVSHKCDVNYSDAKEQNALMRAAKGGHLPILELLLREGAEVLARDANGRNALHHAASKGHAAVCGLLIYFLAKGGDLMATVKLSTEGAAGAGKNGDMHSMGVPMHIRLKVDAVLAAKGVEVAHSALEGLGLAGTQGRVGAAAALDSLHAPPPSLPPSMPGSATPTLPRLPSIVHRAEGRPGQGEAQQGAEKSLKWQPGVHGGEEGGGSGGLLGQAGLSITEGQLDLKGLMAYNILPQVRAFVGRTDKFGDTAADLATRADFPDLAQALFAFLPKADHAGAGVRATGKGFAASSTGVTPRATSHTSSGGPSLKLVGRGSSNNADVLSSRPGSPNTPGLQGRRSSGGNNVAGEKSPGKSLAGVGSLSASRDLRSAAYSGFPAATNPPGAQQEPPAAVEPSLSVHSPASSPGDVTPAGPSAAGGVGATRRLEIRSSGNGWGRSRDDTISPSNSADPATPRVGVHLAPEYD
ncbi:hypothetical protein QJQ45_022432 [Haematococcus lacustris]|nr:hypothetical protein QJQ45_022432 [Haematococcus lacustris]